MLKFGGAAGTKGERSIPSLDGLRALSVLSVIFEHVQTRSLNALTFLLPLRQGELGVAMFFVISGFLITHLLLTEQDETGGIDLRAFYLRRTLRIFPPFYAYVAVVGLLTLAKVYSLPRLAFLCALTYSWNVSTYQWIWIFGHLWSLSLEEQFYLLWPSFVKCLRRATNLRNLAIFFCMAPPMRIAAFLILPTYYRERLHMTLLLAPDHFLVGCVMALAMNSSAYDDLFKRVARLRFAIPASLYLLIVPAYFYGRSRLLRPLFGYTAEALCLGIILSYVVLQPQSLSSRFLNLRTLRHIGVISYSLYLWQQMFTGPDTGRSLVFPANLIAIFACAELSYWLIEKPSGRLKRRLSPGGRRSPTVALAL